MKRAKMSTNQLFTLKKNDGERWVREKWDQQKKEDVKRKGEVKASTLFMLCYFIFYVSNILN